MVFSEKQWVFTYADIEKLTGKSHQSTRHHYSRGYFGETLRSLAVYLARHAEPDLKAEMLLELTNSVDITQLTKKRQNYLAKRREMAAKRRETDQKKPWTSTPSTSTPSRCSCRRWLRRAKRRRRAGVTPGVASSNGVVPTWHTCPCASGGTNGFPLVFAVFHRNRFCASAFLNSRSQVRILPGTLKNTTLPEAQA